MAICYMNYLCDTVMGIYDSDNSGFGYKSVHMEGNYHHSTGSKYVKFNKLYTMNITRKLKRSVLAAKIALCPPPTSSAP